MSEKVIEIRNLKKKYRLGIIGGGTLQGDIQSWWARLRGKEDPNTIIGQDMHNGQKEFMALKGIDLDVYRGEALGIIGGNGAGKSTLLKLLSRVTAPTEGEIRINGRISSMLEVGTGFHGELTGRENIYLNGAILGMNRSEVDKKIDEIIDFSECRQFIDTPVKRYSSGMYVKLAFAVAAHLNSEIMIMDEVLAVGDVKFQEKCLGKMGEASIREGKTILYVSHNMSTIRKLCTRCIVLKEGEIIYSGDTETAIGYYLETNKGEMKQFYDLEEAKRVANKQEQVLYIKSFEFINKDQPIYRCDEKIKFRVVLRAKQKVENLRVYFVLMSAENGMTAGLAQSEIIGSTEREKDYYTILEFDPSNVAEGEYYFCPTLYVMNEYGTFSPYDQPVERLRLKIENSESIDSISWQRRHFGSIRLNTIKTISKLEETDE